MKLNLLILSLIGVSVSASGIRGFVPIKGSDRRLATSKSSSSSKSASGATVAKLVNNLSRNWCQKTLTLDEVGFALSKSTSSKSKSGDRRLASTSKSKSSSTSTDDADVLISRSGGDCIYRLVTSSPKSSSKSSSKDRRRLATSKTTTTTSSKSASGVTVAKLVNSLSRNWCQKTLTLDEVGFALSKSTSSKSKSGDRRLASTSKSKSSSTSTDVADVLISRSGGDCIYRLYTGPSKGTSKSSSKKGS